MLHPDYLQDTTGSVLPEICAPLSHPRKWSYTRFDLSARTALQQVASAERWMSQPGPAGKEYTNADSRYAIRDPFVVAMEAVTAFVEGPGCYAAVVGMLWQRPWVSTVQILVSAGQLYGTVLYFITSVLEGGPSPKWLL